MSDYVYRIRYDRRLFAANTTLVNADLREQIRELLRQLGATPLPNRQQATPTETIQMKALDPAMTEPITLPEGMMEVPVPDALTGPSIHGGTVLLTAINENELMVTVADPGIEPVQCDKIALDLARKIYQKHTGQIVNADEIEVERVGILAYSICQYCRTELHGLPYRCHRCGRTFCRNHISPAEHECSVAAAQVKGGHQVTPQTRETAKPEPKVRRPKITVGRVPCG